MAGGKDTKNDMPQGLKDGVGAQGEQSSGDDSEAETVEQVHQLEEQERAVKVKKDKLSAEILEKKRLKELDKELLQATQESAGALAGSSGGAGAQDHLYVKKKEHFAVFVLTVEGEGHVSDNNIHVMPMHQTPKHNPVQDLRNAEANDVPVKVVILEKGKTYKIFDVNDGK